MNIDRVTITGADDSVDPHDLFKISSEYPFIVEWGILLSASQEGNPRFPSFDWMLKLNHTADVAGLNLSGHLCGKWVRALCRGSNRFVAERPGISHMFQRVQLNFHGEKHDYNKELLLDRLVAWERVQYIFQFDGVNEEIMRDASEVGISVAPLFDKSGGAGVEPETWPPPSGYCGYAGGLHPDRIVEQLAKIHEVVGDHVIWIDVETHVRSDDDKKLDLDKVRKFLDGVKAALPGLK